MFPSSIREINQLPEAEAIAVYSSLLPSNLLQQYSIDPETHATENGHPAIRCKYVSTGRSVEIAVRRYARDIDPIFYLHMTDTFNNQILVLLLVVNDPDAPRFNVDFDPTGNVTMLGTTGRNKPAELAAMQAGLAPGQVRRGLRVFGSLVPHFEAFIKKMGRSVFFIEPLAYHNAIVFEKYGFNYVRGRQAMQEIHAEFQPGGDLHSHLSDENPFRAPNAWRSVRGRSWAIYDGILGYPYTGFQMYKAIGESARICTFPNAEW